MSERFLCVNPINERQFYSPRDTGKAGRLVATTGVVRGDGAIVGRFAAAARENGVDGGVDLVTSFLWLISFMSVKVRG